MPCSPGGSPVVIDVSAVDVVDGATVVMAPPAMSDSVGASARRDSSCSQPMPSSTPVPFLRPTVPAVDPVQLSAMKVSTRGDYASRALLSLSLHAAEAGPTSVRDIAERTGLPQPYLEQILLALKGAGLVRSKRGVGGGYILAREPSTITLGDIVSAVDGPIAVRDFGEPHQDGACNHEGQCVLLAVWAGISSRIRSHLDSFTLATIAG